METTGPSLLSVDESLFICLQDIKFAQNSQLQTARNFCVHAWYLKRIFGKLSIVIEYKYYQSKYDLLPGTTRGETTKVAWRIYNELTKKSKRTPYVNSKYKGFKTDKIFLNLFWAHLKQKRPGDRHRRIRYYRCAIDLLRNTTLAPEARQSTTSKDKLYRFNGQTRSHEKFCVQIKEEVKTGRKYFMSVFPN